MHGPGRRGRRKDPDPFRRPSPPRNPLGRPARQGPTVAPGAGPATTLLPPTDGAPQPLCAALRGRRPMSARRGRFAIGDRGLRPCRQAPPRSRDVIQVSKKFLPGMAVGYSSSKLTLHVGDGFEFMKQNQDAFDVIITDSSDPMGPAESLFKESYYQLMKTALKEDGVLCCQGECQWLHLDLIKEMRQFCQSLFPVVAYAYCTIPTYPSGQIGFMLCSKNPSTNFQEPVQPLTRHQVAQMQLKYYNSDVHRAAFVLPEFARKALNDVS
nr:spermidine synthase [Aotus nancymaae]